MSPEERKKKWFQSLRLLRVGSVVCGVERTECSLLVRCGKLSRMVGQAGELRFIKQLV